MALVWHSPYSEKWADAPEQFTYPWGYQWGGVLGRHRTRSRPPYKKRRLRKADHDAIRRLSKPPEPDHPDQLRLF